jgi:hypothetical protein
LAFLISLTITLPAADPLLQREKNLSTKSMYWVWCSAASLVLPGGSSGIRPARNGELAPRHVVFNRIIHAIFDRCDQSGKSKPSNLQSLCLTPPPSAAGLADQFSAGVFSAVAFWGTGGEAVAVCFRVK